jgi:hypothetical protein
MCIRNMCTILETTFIYLFPPYLCVLCIGILHVCNLAGQEMLISSINSLTLDLGYVHQIWEIENHTFLEYKMLRIS